MSKYWDNITKMAQKQEEKGLATYGQTLDKNTDLGVIERITMAQEEAIDILMYLEHLKSGISDNEFFAKIQKQIDFEEKWINDVMNEKGRVSSMDISTAMDGIRFVVQNMMGGMK